MLVALAFPEGIFPVGVTQGQNRFLTTQRLFAIIGTLLVGISLMTITLLIMGKLPEHKALPFLALAGLHAGMYITIYSALMRAPEENGLH